MLKRRFIAVLLAAGLVLGSAAFDARADQTAAPQATTAGQAIIGFAPGWLPQLAVGDTLVGRAIRRVSTNGSFLVVDAADLTALRAQLGAVPGIAYVEDNLLARATVAANDPRIGEQYGVAQMGFPAAWNQVGFGSAAVKVAVLDSGVRKAHQDLTGPRMLQGYDYLNNDGEPNDDCGHGTHTIGTVGASTNNAVGVAGMVQATLLPFKVLELTGLILTDCTGDFASISQAIMDAADQGAKVISMSIGGPSGNDTLANAVNYATSKGSIIVAAGGNDGSANDIDYPAAYPNVVAVGAVTSAKAKASYSDTGAELDIVAPGSNVLSTSSDSNTAYESMNGTSMATPHVAGALALAAGCAPAGTTAAQLVNALYTTAEDLGTAGKDVSFGHGLARVDRLVAAVCSGGSGGNHNPTAAFTKTTNGLTVNVNAGGSSDSDGDPLTYAWTFGDGSATSGVNASHTYAAAGTYTVKLIVKDNKGGSATMSKAVTVSGGGDTTPSITSGQQVKVQLSASSTQKFFKIVVPAGTTKLRAVTTGPACTSSSCPVDAALYVRPGQRPTDSAFACKSAKLGNNESCVRTNPAANTWYVRVQRTSGAGAVNLKVTLTA